VDAERQAVAGGVDLAEQRRQVLAVVAQHVQDRAEHLALELGEASDLDHRRQDEAAMGRGLASARVLHYMPACGVHRLDVALDAGARLLVDHRADVDRQGAGVPDRELAQRAFEHRHQARRRSRWTQSTRRAEQRWPALSKAE
jgi:hypothetical protein